MQLAHEKLDVYRVSLDFAAWAYDLSRGLKCADRHARDQLLCMIERGSQVREEGIVYGNVNENAYGEEPSQPEAGSDA